MGTERNRQTYTKEFKADAVKLVIEQGYSCTEVGRRLGINHSNVTRWVREHRNAQEEPTEGGFPVENLKPKTVVWLKKTDGCKWSEKS